MSASSKVAGQPAGKVLLALVETVALAEVDAEAEGEVDAVAVVVVVALDWAVALAPALVGGRVAVHP
ncbi:MAG: hypothetical protein U0271_24820 [Polyangiaceae bacterium]